MADPQSNTNASIPAGWSKTPPNLIPSGWSTTSPSADVPRGTLDQISATPPSQHPVQDWLHDLDADVTSGGGRTLPGRIMGHMQLRGDKGYSGLETGSQAAAGHFMGSPLLGTIHAAQGVAETPDHPIMGPLHAIKGVMEAGTIPSLMYGGEGGLETAIDAIPSRTHAASMLGDIENAAHDVPVSMTHTRPALDEFGQSVQTGGKNAPVMTKLTKRISPATEPKVGMLGRMEGELNGSLPEPPTTPDPVMFPEARDFYTNISRSTAKPGLLRRAIENPSMPSFRMNAGNVREALNSDLTDAADSIGRGSDYTDAMNEYRRAAQLNKGIKAATKVGIGGALAATGLKGPVSQFIQGTQ